MRNYGTIKYSIIVFSLLSSGIMRVREGMFSNTSDSTLYTSKDMDHRYINEIKSRHSLLL